MTIYLDEQAIFWFASTVAQTVVAMLAFAAFLAAWRLDSVTDAGEAAIGSLRRELRSRLGQQLADVIPPEELDPKQRNTFCNEGSRHLRTYLTEVGVTVPETFHLDEPGIWNSHRNWETTLAIADGISERRQYIVPRLANGETNVSAVEKRANGVRLTVRLIGDLRRWLRILMVAGFASLGTSLVVVGLGAEIAKHDVAGWGLLAPLVAATVAAVYAALRLGLAIFEQPEAWE